MRASRAALVIALAALGTMSGVSTAAAPRVNVVSHGTRTSPRVALTFDDGVSPANCRRILATLVARHVPATFFPIAEAMRADPAFWRMVVAEGDPIGDHTMTHPEMPTLTETRQFAQIDDAGHLVEQISGAPLLRVFRPPYGAYDTATLQAARSAGFQTVLLWDASDRDTSLHGTVAEMLAAAERATNGSVLLMHCGPNATPYLLGRLLDHLQQVGLRPVTVPALLGLAWTGSPASSPPTPAEILDGLPALPPTSSGGVVVGPNGIGSMTFPPGPPPTNAAGPSPMPTVTMGTPAPTQPAAPSSAPPAATSIAPSLAASTPPSTDEVEQPSSPAAASDSPALAAIVGALMVAAILLAGVARRRRR